jgi:hypothetical protein
MVRNAIRASLLDEAEKADLLKTFAAENERLAGLYL